MQLCDLFRITNLYYGPRAHCYAFFEAYYPVLYYRLVFTKLKTVIHFFLLHIVYGVGMRFLMYYIDVIQLLIFCLLNGLTALFYFVLQVWSDY